MIIIHLHFCIILFFMIHDHFFIWKWKNKNVCVFVQIKMIASKQNFGIFHVQSLFILYSFLIFFIHSFSFFIHSFIVGFILFHIHHATESFFFEHLEMKIKMNA